MSKELTEKWRNGALESGMYYIRINDFGKEKIIIHNINASAFFYDQNVLLEVIAPVPDYNQFVELNEKVEMLKKDNKYLKSGIETRDKQIERLVKQLKEDVKTIHDQELIIKKLKRRRICDNQKTKARKEHINELIEDIKELKEELAGRGRLINELKTQRKEANDVILKIKRLNEIMGVPEEITVDYLNKWGVK